MAQHTDHECKSQWLPYDLLLTFGAQVGEKIVVNVRISRSYKDQS